MEPDGASAPSAWAEAEYRALRRIQSFVPTFTPLALAVHYLVLEEFLVPLFASCVWLISHSKFVSLCTFIAINNIFNSFIKWIVQRGRPAWCRRGGVINVRGAWEKDLSFPSGHTQFLSGTAMAACALFELPAYSSTAAMLFGLFVGTTRNYLGVHFCTDTLIGWAIGVALGSLWGAYDPYSQLLRRADPWLSFVATTTLCAGLLLALLLVLALVPPVPEKEKRRWLHNATATLPPETRDALQAGGEAHRGSLSRLGSSHPY